MSSKEYVFDFGTMGYGSHPQGNILICPQPGPGGYPWRSDIPSRPDSQAAMKWPIIGMYGVNRFQTLWYYNGRFRSASGNYQSNPIQWMYLRLEPQAWNESLGVWEIPGLSSVPSGPAPAEVIVPIELQEIIDLTKKLFYHSQIMLALDRSKFNKPEPGVPL